LYIHRWGNIDNVIGTAFPVVDFKERKFSYFSCIQQVQIEDYVLIYLFCLKIEEVVATKTEAAETSAKA